MGFRPLWPGVPCPPRGHPTCNFLAVPGATSWPQPARPRPPWWATNEKRRARRFYYPTITAVCDVRGGNLPCPAAVPWVGSTAGMTFDSTDPPCLVMLLQWTPRWRRSAPPRAVPSATDNSFRVIPLGEHLSAPAARTSRGCFKWSRDLPGTPCERMRCDRLARRAPPHRRCPRMPSGKF